MTGRTSYRPGYELVAEQLLAYIAEQDLRPGDRLPTEKGLAETARSGTSSRPISSTWPCRSTTGG
jgi:GntR family transcriptional repressor for pyruvate dehydrogenase complex